jgi:amidase
MRALGLPGVVVPMGEMEDTGMPVGITFAGPAYADCALLAAAFAYENATCWRADPLHAPVAPHERLHPRGEPGPPKASGDAGSELRVEVDGYDGAILRVAVEVTGAPAPTALRVTVDGVPVDGVQAAAGRQELAVRRASRGGRTTADGPPAGLVVAVAGFDGGARLGAFAEFDPPARYEPAAAQGPARGSSPARVSSPNGGSRPRR